MRHFLPVFVTGGRNPVDFTVHGRQFFQNQSGIFNTWANSVTGSLPFMETSCGRGSQRSSMDRSAPGRQTRVCALYPRGRVCARSSGMRLFEIFYFICRHGKPGAVSGYRRHECFS